MTIKALEEWSYDGLHSGTLDEMVTTNVTFNPAGVDVMAAAVGDWADVLIEFPQSMQFL